MPCWNLCFTHSIVCIYNVNSVSLPLYLKPVAHVIPEAKLGRSAAAKINRSLGGALQLISYFSPVSFPRVHFVRLKGNYVKFIHNQENFKRPLTVAVI